MVFQVFQVFHVFHPPACHRRWRIVVNSMQAEAQPERSLETESEQIMSLGEGRLWQVTTLVFQVFQLFHFASGPKKWSKSSQNPGVSDVSRIPAKFHPPVGTCLRHVIKWRSAV